MASYSLFLKPSVEKDLGRLPRPLLAKIWRKIESLSYDPLPRQSTKLAGAEHLYRLRVGDYRVIYTIDHRAKHILVHYVRHRRDAYRNI
jgi:mRNA interferase RelE/StbE